MLRLSVLVLLAMVVASTALSSPIVDLRPADSRSYLSEETDTFEGRFIVDMNDAPAGAHRIAWRLYVDLNDGLLLAGGSQECMQAMQDSCCSLCSNGVHCNGSVLPGTSYRQFCYIPYPVCNGAVCSSSCSGDASDGTFMKFYVKMDMDYWASYGPGTYYRYVYLVDVNDPGNENIWSCCEGNTSIECDGCGGYCAHLGFTIGTALQVCIKIPASKTGPIFALQQKEEPSEPQVTGVAPGESFDFERRLTEVLNEISNSSEKKTWGGLKFFYK